MVGAVVDEPAVLQAAVRPAPTTMAAVAHRRAEVPRSGQPTIVAIDGTLTTTMSDSAELSGVWRPLAAAVLSLALIGTAIGRPNGASATTPKQYAGAAALGKVDLRLAADAVEAQAISSGALRHRITSSSPAVVLLLSDQALIRAALATDPSHRPADTRAVMGPVPDNLAHHERHRPAHFTITRTRTLDTFSGSVAASGSAGIGNREFRGATVAAFQKPDGVYVDPRLPSRRPTIGEVALRAALQRLGQPYTWGGAGPSTYDCSGLVLRAYATAGIELTHFSGYSVERGSTDPGARCVARRSGALWQSDLSRRDLPGCGLDAERPVHRALRRRAAHLEARSRRRQAVIIRRGTAGLSS
jgi:cell wall-associated NlpC family hydrolase